jgi:adenosylcobinamide-GDP ribazoletransferase
VGGFIGRAPSGQWLASVAEPSEDAHPMPDVAARLRTLPADTLSALAFFSRVPVRPQPTTFDLRRIAGAWPVCGAVLAFAPALLFLVASTARIPPIAAAVLAFAAMAFLTGGMHEDGLADTADGFGGGATREAKLDLMHDSRLGTFGALALIFAVVLKVVALGAIGGSPWRGALALVCVAAISRALALWHWSATMPARTDGMAASAGRPDSESLAVATLVAFVASVLLLIAFHLAAILALLLAAAGVTLFSQLAERQIGGHTGDTIGAAQQISEALLFTGLASAATTVLA